MPTRELINLGGEVRYGFNVGHTVGIAGANHFGDVLIIQAMFKYIHRVYGDAVVPLPFSGEMGLNLTGQYDFGTMNAIMMFQAEAIQYIIAADGNIHPASYHGRKIGLEKKLMTITWLHRWAYKAGEKIGDGDYTIGIMRMFPQALPALIGQLVPAGKV